MAFRPALRQLSPVLMAAVAGSAVVCAPRRLDAEEPSPEDSLMNRKPIYDETPLADERSLLPPSPITSPTSPTPSADSKPYRPTPTDRLAVQISHGRIYLYQQAVKAEDAVNDTLTKALRLEHSFTSTVRSLAPPKESNEKLLPGVLYVLVASMAGSIVTRNRNILLRATVPAVVGIGAAYAVLPLTMRNVGDLAWTYEERFPAVAQTHLQTKARIQQFLETGKAHSTMTVGMVQDKIAEARGSMEDWVRKGK